MREPPEVQYERELRLAVVMYGGVSLAVYINGATQELLHFVRATAPDSYEPGRARFTDAELGAGSARVYREVARLTTRGGGAAGEVESGAPIRQRFVVDILSGTSAGGINAVFLAKALANGQSLDGLADLWQTEADLDLLINDADSRRGIEGLPPNRDPRSLLNGARMYRKLLDAFASMDGARDDLDALVDEVDLFVTATDLEGLVVNLQLGGGEVARERRYKKSFHLARTRDRNDFTAGENPFLAFVSRCTSSFPVAFEPMQYAAGPAAQAGAAIPERWKRHFLEYGDAGSGLETAEARPFADGGYLDNKPFSHAIDQILKRRGGASGWVERKLVYIEPDPERLSEGPGRRTEPPDAVQNALAVLKLRSYETIREDLLRLRDRNRLVERVWTVVAGMDSDFDALDEGARARLAAIIGRRDGFFERALDDVVVGFGSAYGGYHRLKVGQLTDELAAMLASHAGIASQSDESRAVRLLVRAWRDANFPASPARPAAGSAPPPGADQGSEFEYLSAFDLSYRIRRVTFVIERINRLRVLDPAELAAELGQYASICGGPAARSIAVERPLDLVRAFDRLRQGLGAVMRELRAARERLVSPLPEQVRAEIAAHAAAVQDAAARILAEPSEDRRRDLATAEVAAGVGGTVGRAIAAMDAVARGVVRSVADEARLACQRLLRTDGTPQLARPSGFQSPDEVAEFVGRHYYTWYELYDSMLFPILLGTEVGEEIAAVEPIRISPLTGRDAAGQGVPDPQLMPAGVALGHFGAFLSADWRARDILIGRMNAAEKLIRAALAGSGHDQPALVDGWVRQAHAAILQEESARPESIVGRRLEPVRHLSPEARLDYIKRKGIPPADPPPDAVLSWVARSAKVMGRVLLEASQRPTAKKLASGLLYAGHFLAGAVEVVVPRHWWGMMLRLWIPRLLVFAAALVFLGALLGKDQVSALGWTTLGVALGAIGVTSLLRGLIGRKGSWIVRAATSLIAVAFVGVVVIGIVYLPDAVREVGARMAALLGR